MVSHMKKLILLIIVIALFVFVPRGARALKVFLDTNHEQMNRNIESTPE